MAGGLRSAAAVALGATVLSGFASLATPGQAATTRRHVALRADATTASTADPSVNVPPSPDYWPTCTQQGNSSQACTDAVVQAIDNARALEGVGPLVLPSGFAAMTPAQQTFVVSNLERIDRGLTPAAGTVDTLDTLAAQAAAADADPVLSSWTVGPFAANRWGSIWAGDINALAADYDWMYNDGWGPTGSYNLDCTSATASGCWGHRHNILSTYGGEEVIAGVGSVVQSQWTSIAQIFVAGTGTYPAFTVSWSDLTGAPAPAPAPAPSPSSTTSPAPTPTPSGVASTNTVTASPDATSLALSAPGTVTSGAVARLVARVVDTTASSPVAGAAVSVCARPAGGATSCTSATADGNGTLVLQRRLTASTAYWVVYAGDTGHAAATSRQALVKARPVVRLHATRVGRTWLVAASMTPARGQQVQLQRETAGGWTTVRRTTARATLAFTRLPRGTYRLVVSATAAATAATARVRAA